jgi:hypothetical protein
LLEWSFWRQEVVAATLRKRGLEHQQASEEARQPAHALLSFGDNPSGGNNQAGPLTTRSAETPIVSDRTAAC